MKVFTSQKGQLNRGLRYQWMESEKRHVALFGRKEIGCEHKMVKFDKKAPPIELGKTTILNTDVTFVDLADELELEEKRYYSFEEPLRRKFLDPRVLLRMDLYWEQNKDCMGKWKVIEGQVTEIFTLKGRYEHLDRDLQGTWSDSLLIMYPSSVIKVMPEGELEDDDFDKINFVLECDDQGDIFWYRWGRYQRKEAALALERLGAERVAH